MSPRAKHVLYPALAIAFITFFSFVTHLLLLGTSAFPNGRILEGRYLVEDHGKVIELTATQYWFSYIHGIALVAVFAGIAALVAVFSWTGDLKNEHRS